MKSSDYLIVFDFDGTLVNSLGKAEEAFNFALKQIGHPNIHIEEVRKYFGISADKIFLNLLRNESIAQKAFENYLTFQASIVKTTYLFDGVKNLLDILKSKSLALGIVTGRHRKDLQLLLDHLAIESYFSLIVADSDLKTSKPSPEGLLYVCEKLDKDPSSLVYIGDSASDIKAAHNANSISIAALWDPLVDKESLLAEKPNHILMHPLELLNALKI